MYSPILVTGFIWGAILILKTVSFCKRSYLLWLFITRHIIAVYSVQMFIISHYCAVSEMQRYCFTTFSIIPQCDHCSSTNHEAAQYDHNTVVQYSIDACLSHCWSCKFYWEKNPCSVGIFYPPECLNHETDLQFRQVVQASFSFCVSPSLVSLFSFSLTTFFVSSLSLLHRSAEGIKTSHKQFDLNAWQN